MPQPAAAANTLTARGGTIRYMAPEQFVTGHSSVQSDVWALGVILYELASGRHPFARCRRRGFPGHPRHSVSGAAATCSTRAAAFLPELKSVIRRCLEKNPAARYVSAGEVREALRTVMRALQIEPGIVPWKSRPACPSPAREAEKRATGILSMLAERFRESGGRARAAEIHRGGSLRKPRRHEVAPFFGLALADAIAARLARIPSLVVRPSSTLMTVAGVPGSAHDGPA